MHGIVNKVVQTSMCPGQSTQANFTLFIVPCETMNLEYVESGSLGRVKPALVMPTRDRTIQASVARFILVVCGKASLGG